MVREKAMSVAEAREHMGREFLFELPSGLIFNVRKVAVYEYIQNGITEIPNEFYSMVAKLGKKDAEKDLTEKETIRNFDLIQKFVELSLHLGCLEPLVMIKYEEEKKDTHLLYSDLSDDDKNALLSAIMGK